MLVEYLFHIGFDYIQSLESYHSITW
jgi:hypothetical protein